MNNVARIFVTGGTGFFGRSLLRHWIERWNRGVEIPKVTVLTRSLDNFLGHYPEFQKYPWLHFHTGDILKPESLPKAQSFTHVLHAATDSTLGPQLSARQRYIQIVNGTENILEYAVDCGAKRFLLTSSGGVYGPQPEGMDKIPEDYNGMPDPLNPANAYGVAKRAAEHLCALYQDMHGIEAVIARCFAFVGQDLPLDVHFAIGNFIRDALWADEIVVGGDGTPVRSYLDQRDLAIWLLTMLEKGQAGRAYNLGSDEAVTISDLAHLVGDIVAPGMPVRILGKSVSLNNGNRYVPDVTRARTELGLGVAVPLAKAIERAAEFVGRKKG
jgi:dTDP-glucose 4,6-dehydratase